MKNFKCFIMLMGIFSIFMAGCSGNGLENEGNKVIVQKRVGEEDNYAHFKEITDEASVTKAKKILDSIRWENAEVSMAYPPHYKFRLAEENEQPDLLYSLWISPNKDKVELVIEGKSKYAQLSKKKSARLYEAITDENLSKTQSNK